MPIKEGERGQTFSAPIPTLARVIAEIRADLRRHGISGMRIEEVELDTILSAAERSIELERALNKVVKEGWVMVPRILTGNMVRAATKAAFHAEPLKDWWEAIWEAILAAVPKAGEGG